MRTNDKDKHLLLHIEEYCNQVQETVIEIGNCDNLESNFIYQNALAMPLLQIGELARNISDDLKEKYSDVPWVEIRALRNVFVHSYGKVDWKKVWETGINDIPELKEKCSQIIIELDKVKSKAFSR